MGTTTTAQRSGTPSIPRLTRATITQYLASQRRLVDAARDGGVRKVVLLRSAPQWDGPAETGWGDDLRATVAAAPSPLAVHERILDHLAVTTAGSGPNVLVVLTDREETELDPGLLARVHHRRIESVDGWDVIREAFGATQLDPALHKERWAAEALLDAAPPGSWPKVAGGVLSRHAALTRLALRRLRLGEPEAGGADGLDMSALFRWSMTQGRPEAFRELRTPEQEGLSAFLAEPEQGGTAARALMSLIADEHGSDAVAFSLVCAALWTHAPEDADTFRARGRAERRFSSLPKLTGEELDHLVSAFGAAGEEYVCGLLAQAGSAEPAERDRREARRLASTALEQAASLVRQFGAEAAAAHSPVLPSGLEARFTQAGEALTAGTQKATTAAISDLETHALSDASDTQARIRRAEMALRLVRWLDTRPTSTAQTVGAAIERHIAETGWVDRALEHLEAGGDPDPRLKAAYDSLGIRVRELRRELDRSFAGTLATWTAAGTTPGSMLTVESFLDRIVKPVAHKSDRRLLLLVLDGMSSAIAAELAEEIRNNFAEFDPYTGNDKGEPRRRAIAAALPTLTAVSRTSLLTGRLTKGTQVEEKREFPALPLWRGAQAAVFHKDDLRSDDTGAPFGPALAAALGDSHVAVVLNTIDDRLAKEQKLGDGSWDIGQVAGLRPLLSEALAQGMAVLVTSDHGHVVDRHPAKAEPTGGTVASARHRTPGGPLGETEVALAGPRVVWPEPDAEIVALWDADSRYTALKAGYHGGASLAEFAIPLLAFLPFGADAVPGWRELDDPRPRWWQLEEPTEPTAPPAEPETRPGQPRKKAQPKPKADTVAHARTHDSLFQLPEPQATEPPIAPAPMAEKAPEPAAEGSALVTELLATPLFEGQLGLVSRARNSLGQIEKALEALVRVNTMPVTALAQRAGVTPASRAAGFAAVLSQLLNYDGVQVLETLPDGRTVRLHISLLKDQFELERSE